MRNGAGQGRDNDGVGGIGRPRGVETACGLGWPKTVVGGLLSRLTIPSHIIKGSLLWAD